MFFVKQKKNALCGELPRVRLLVYATKPLVFALNVVRYRAPYQKFSNRCEFRTGLLGNRYTLWKAGRLDRFR